MERNLARFDIASEMIDSSTSGTLSSIQDINIGVLYSINTQHSNCTVSPLGPTTDTYVGKDGRYHLRYVNDLFFLSAVHLSYAGNMSAHGIILDNWNFKGDFSHFGYNYSDATLQWSITQAGQSIATLSSITTSPLPWRISLEATVFVDETSFNFFECR